MRSFRLIILLPAVVSLLTLPQPAEADTPVASGRLGRAVDTSQPHTSHSVLAKFEEGVDPSGLMRGAKLIFDRWYTVPVAADETPIQAVRRLIGTPGVAVAELNYVVTAWPDEGVALQGVGVHPMSTPNDPGYVAQWHFPQVQANSAWDVSTGSGVTVAVIDGGVSQGGEDLDCRTFVSPFDATADSAGLGTPDSHGTHVSGTIAQCTNNGIGVAGLAYGASLMPINVIGASGTATAANVAQAIDWARTHGARVINMSLGSECTTTWPSCSSSIQNDAIAAAAAADIVIVAAAGNENSSYVGTPANNPDVIAVGATRYDMTRAPYSNRGTALDVVAPGGDLSLDQNGDGYADGVLQETFLPTWGYYFLQGTSMASPHVAAAAAILRSYVPTATRQQVMDALFQSARDLGAAGYDTSYGYGLIQIRSALDRLGSAPPPSGADLSLTKQDGPDPVAAGGTLTFTLTVTNNGPEAATGVTITDVLPSGVGFVSAASCQGTSTVTCSIGNLAAGTGATRAIVVTAPSGGTITNTASVTSSSTDLNPSNNNATSTTTVGGGSTLATSLTGSMKGWCGRDGRYYLYEHDATVRFKAQLSPAVGGAALEFELWQWDGTAWEVIATQTYSVRANGSRKVRITRLGSNAYYSVRARFLGDATYSPSRSRFRYFRGPPRRDVGCPSL